MLYSYVHLLIHLCHLRYIWRDFTKRLVMEIWCVCVLFKVQWELESEPNEHCSQMLVKHALTVFGRHWPLVDVDVVARQVR